MVSLTHNLRKRFYFSKEKCDIYVITTISIKTFVEFLFISTSVVERKIVCRNSLINEVISSFDSHPLFHIYTGFDIEGHFGERVRSVIKLHKIKLTA